MSPMLEIWEQVLKRLVIILKLIKSKHLLMVKRRKNFITHPNGIFWKMDCNTTIPIAIGSFILAYFTVAVSGDWQKEFIITHTTL